MSSLPFARSLTLCAVLGFGAAAHAQSFEMQRRTFDAGSHTYRARVGQLTLPQFHDDAEKGRLRIAVAVLETAAEEPGPPVFFLNGIPGAATSMCDSELWAAYLETSDVVLIDQRGCGRSEPVLVWDRAPFDPAKLLADERTAKAHAIETASAIREFTAEHGVHLSAFNTRESARDVDAVRAALGYEKIHVVGHSGGAHLGFEYVRSFGEHVARFVSIGTAGPNDIHSLPSRLDASLRKVSELAAADPRIGESMPDLYAALEEVMEALDREPVVVELRRSDRADPVEVRVGRQGLAFLLLLDLGDPADFVVFPRLVHELRERRTDTLSWFVRRRHAQLAEWPALLFVNRGMSGATPERWARIRKEARSSPFGMVRCNFSPELDAAFGTTDLGDAFRAPVESDVPTLFVSGTLDANTPPERAEAALAGFEDGRHLVVENAGHDAILYEPRVHDAIRAFLGGAEVEGTEIALPVPRFALLEGRDALVDHPALR